MRSLASEGPLRENVCRGGPIRARTKCFRPHMTKMHFVGGSLAAKLKRSLGRRWRRRSSFGACSGRERQIRRRGGARNNYTGELMHHALRGPAARGAYFVERVDKTNGAQRPLHLSGRRLASAGHHRNQDRVDAENKSTITRAATANCSAVESDAVADFICARFVLLAPTRASIVRPWVASSFEAANLRSDAAQRSNNAR